MKWFGKFGVDFTMVPDEGWEGNKETQEDKSKRLRSARRDLYLGGKDNAA